MFIRTIKLQPFQFGVKLDRILHPCSIYQGGNQLTSKDAAGVRWHGRLVEHLACDVAADIPFERNAAAITGELYSQLVQAGNRLWHQDETHSGVVREAAALI